MDIDQTSRSDASDPTTTLALAPAIPAQPNLPATASAAPKQQATDHSMASVERPAMLRASLVRIFEPEDVLRRLREMHGKSYLDHLNVASQALKLPGGSGDRRDLGSSAQAMSPTHASSEPTAWRLSIREQMAARSEIAACVDDEARPVDPAAHLTHEESLRSKRLHEVLLDQEEGWRPPLIATPGVLAAIEDLRATAPQFEHLISIIANAAAMSAATGLPLKVPSILLLGPPGIGKTFLASRIAAAIGSAFVSLQMNLTPAFGLMAGLSMVWKGAGPGKIATMLLASKNAAPVMLFDELEKTVIASAYDRPLDVMHSLWEGENAVAFRDEYFDIPFNAAGLVSIATANSTTGISQSLLDRLLVLDIRPPTADQRREIARQIYRRATIDLADLIAPELRPDILDHLARETPRRMTKIVALALPMAIAAGRDAICIDNFCTAQALLDSAKPEARQPIGFLQSVKRRDT